MAQARFGQFAADGNQPFSMQFVIDSANQQLTDTYRSSTTVSLTTTHHASNQETHYHINGNPLVCATLAEFFKQKGVTTSSSDKESLTVTSRDIENAGLTYQDAGNLLFKLNQTLKPGQEIRKTMTGHGFGC